MPTSPLDNLQQQIYDDRNNLGKRYLLLSSVHGKTWNLQLWSEVDGQPCVWTGEAGEVKGKEILVAESIKGGIMHVEEGQEGTIKLYIHVEDHEAVTVDFTISDTTSRTLDLLHGAFELVSRPIRPSFDKDELRTLRAKLGDKEAEIGALSSKLTSLKATVIRATGTDKKPIPGPTKKAPANASLLQPNQKRRKLVEDEFASSEEDDD